MKRVKFVPVLPFLAALFFAGTVFAQTDPGVRTGGGRNTHAQPHLTGRFG